MWKSKAHGRTWIAVKIDGHRPNWVNQLLIRLQQNATIVDLNLRFKLYLRPTAPFSDSFCFRRTVCSDSVSKPHPALSYPLHITPGFLGYLKTYSFIVDKGILVYSVRKAVVVYVN